MSGRERAPARVAEADVLRALACLVVFFLHGLLAGGARAGESAPALEAAARLLYQTLLWATPLFAVLSGFVLFHRHPEPPAPQEFWRRRLGTVLLPFLFWTVMAGGLYPAPITPQYLGGLLLGQVGTRHLYFVAMILQFYALFPWLARWTAGERLWRALPAVFLLSVAYLAVFAYVPAPAGPARWLWEWSHSFLPAWAFYLLLGGALARHPEALRRLAGRPAPAWGLAASGVLLLCLEFHFGAARLHDTGSDRPALLLYTLLVLPLLWRAASRLSTGRGYGLSRTVAAHSFAIYLVHPLLLGAMDRWLPVPAPFLARVAIYLGVCALLTAAVVLGLGRLPFGARLLGLSRPATPAARYNPPRAGTRGLEPAVGLAEVRP